MDQRELALQKIAIRCRKDLYFLAREILDYSKMEPHVHQELCDYTTSILPSPPETNAIQEKHPDFDPRKNLLLLLMPRGTFKSSVVTIGFTLQMMLNDPNCRILIDSETFSKSKAFLREIIEHLLNNEAYREIFKTVHGMYPFEKKSSSKLWTDSELILPCRTRALKEPSISCAGIDVTKNGMHYDLIICDDLHSEKNVTNKEQILQVIDHYKLAFSLLDPGKPLIVIGTRWDYSDLYQHIIDFEAEDFNILIKSAYNPDGSLFFPEVLTEEALDKIRRRQGTGIFSKQYLNEPVSDENATFKRSQLVRKSWAEVQGRPINWYLSGDPSYYDPRGLSSYGDFCALVLVGMDFQRDLYIKWITRKKLTYSEFIDEIFRIYTDPKLKEEGIKDMKIVIEAIGTKSLSLELSNEQRRRNTWLPVTEIKSGRKNKEERIRGLAPFYEYGHIYHIKECPQIEELEYELLHFPSGRHDDICFSAGTKVFTSLGQKNIEDVTTNDLVMTRKGFKKVLKAGTTGYAQTIRGLGLRATPNHPFITTTGVKRFDKLSVHDTLHVWNEKLLSIEQRTITDIQTQNGDNTKFISGGTINGNKRQSLSIAKSGLIISERYQRAISFITEMKLLSTMTPQTLSYSPSPNTLNFTQGNQLDGINLVRIFGRLKKKRRSGTEVQRDGNGTGNMPSKWDSEKVYNLQVEGSNEYFANNILVHNCDALATVLEVASPPNQKGFEASDKPSKKRLLSYKPRSAITGT